MIQMIGVYLALLSGTVATLQSGLDTQALPSTRPGEVPYSMRDWPSSVARAAEPGEIHLTNLKQITFGGQNAEAYVNVEGTQLSWQTAQPGFPDEQVCAMRLDGTNRRLISTGLGRCTCSYFSPDGRWIYFSSTHEGQPGPQPPIDRSKGYVWAVNEFYQMFRARPDGSHLEKMVSFPGHYVAETTIDPNGKYMVWTSDKDGDLEIYRSDLQGKHIKRLTQAVGYDGGPFVSWDGKKVVYRRDTFADGTPQAADYKALLAQHLVRPTKLEIWIMDPDGSHKRQVTHLNCASFAPFLAPDGKRIIFSSNYGDPKGRAFNLFLINVDGTGLEQVTQTHTFEGFPMFTKDGKHLVFASDRYGSKERETNLFVADWKN
jgi:Tol biopolymer transport system component